MRSPIAPLAALLALACAPQALAQASAPAAAQPGAVNPMPPGASRTPPAAPQAAPPAATPAAPTTAAPPSTTSNAQAPTGAAANTATTAPAVASGMTVKDNTGAAIGQITGITTDASGAQLAKIQMGADVFTVEVGKLGVQNGAATINATQAQLKSMLAGRKP
jgi:hypothetical protein